MAKQQTTEELMVLVKENLLARAKGLLPDEWFWADLELIKRGIFYNPFNGKVLYA